MRVLRSNFDESVNFVDDLEPGQKLEARYVRRPDSRHVSCYLSSQTACAMACRFCHLTATGQNVGRNATRGEMLRQARAVLDHYVAVGETADLIHYNFMARGEPLLNPAVDADLFEALDQEARSLRARSKMCVSTIMPQEVENLDLVERLGTRSTVVIYYSLYSLDERFRRRHIPRAMNATRAIQKLAAWQAETSFKVKIHHALIEGENDDRFDARRIAHNVAMAGLHVDYNLVAYNPPNARTGRESERYFEYAEALRSESPASTIKIIPRVGFDVAASCGMFLT